MLHAELTTLPNGLRVVTVPDENAESASFSLVVASGSRHERPRLSGISHFIEHMLFKGTAKRTARDINRAIEGVGGELNAYTSEQTTSYYARVPHERLATAVDVICDMYRNASVPDSEFERERQVVLQEIKMYEDDPSSVASDILRAGLFPKSPLGVPVSGDEKTLAAMTPQLLRDYVRRAYVPSATVAVVAGRMDPAKAVALVSERLGDLKKGRPLAFAGFDDAVPVVRESVVSREVMQTQLMMGWRLPFGVRGDARFTLNMLNVVMGYGMSSRLFESVREKRGLSYDIQTLPQLFDETGCWCVAGGVEPSRADEMRSVIEREIERLRTKRVGAAELRRAKDFHKGNVRLAMERASTRITFFGGGVMTHGRIVSLDETMAKLEAVTPEMILEFARTYLVPERLAVAKVVPKEASR